MPTTPTAKAGLLPVPDSHDVPIIALDLGADDCIPQVRQDAIDRMIVLGLRPTAPGSGLGRPRGVFGWSAVFHRGHLTLHSPDPDEVVYAGALTLWPSLRAAIRANRWVLVYAGHIGLGGDTDMLTALRTAADQGHCTSGIVHAPHPSEGV